MGLLEAGYPRIACQPLVELPVADFDADHRGRPVLQEAVGEAAGRHADVERHHAVAIDAAFRQRMGQLGASPGSEARFGRFPDPQFLFRKHGLRRAADRGGRAAGDDVHRAGLDQPLRQRARAHQAAVDQRHVGSDRIGLAHGRLSTDFAGSGLPPRGLSTAGTGIAVDQ